MSAKDKHTAVLRERYISLLASKAKRGGQATKLMHRLRQNHEPAPVTLPRVKWLERPDP